MDLIIAVLMLVFCYGIGTIIEKNHYKKIRERELKLYRQPYITFAKNVNKQKTVLHAEFVSASVVIACDHFKEFLANLRNIFGGNISAYESVLDRGRREAILRIREKALKRHANVVVNVKIDTVMLNPLINGRNGGQNVCIIAYGTAVEYAKQ